MEPRTLLTVAIPFDPATDGYTPAQIRKAYGFDQASFANGTVPADGRGQTIAIVDAFDNPTIVDDLATFDSQFGLPAPPSFRVVDQRGGTNLPSPDIGWAGEIALDVEWSHVVAPMANILLVEADDSSNGNLGAAVDFARNQPGVSVVSMSWGGAEFFQWVAGSVLSQLAFDPVFTTPVGHQGVTFVASAGDSGAVVGVQHPSGAPTVLSVGGTSLNVADPSGTYGSEAYWTGTNSGYSNLETEPTYQRGVQAVGFRSAPDVTYNADPNTGFALFSEFATTGDPTGMTPGFWQPIGGTSAGAPQWAALIALANQGRVLNGMGTLDGPSQTLPILYGLYSPPFTPGYANYTKYFNDVTIPANSTTIHWRWGGVGFNDAIPVQGFDTATGLGSPKAAPLIQALSTLDAPARLPITGSFISALAASVIAGAGTTLKFQLTNTSSVPFDGPVDITFFASTDTVLSADDTRVFAYGTPSIKLKPGASKKFNIKFDFPADLVSGTYHLIAAISSPEANSSPSAVVASSPITITAANGDIAASFVGNPVLVRPGQNATAILRIQNVGNTLVTGNFGLTLYASADQTLDPTVDEGLLGISRRVDLKPGKSMIIRIPFVAPIDKAGGSYFLIASITPSVQPADPNAANNVAVIATRATGRAARALGRMRVKWHLL